MKDSYQYLIGSAIIVLVFTIAFSLFSPFSGDLSNPEYEEYLSIRDQSNCTRQNDSFCMNRSGCVHIYRACQIAQCGNEGIGWSVAPEDEKVCVIGDNGECKVDITEEYRNVSADRGRECGALDRYYETTRYICVKEITDTVNPFEKERGADKVVTTYFTEIDGNTYIMDSEEIPDLQPGHQYSIASLTQVGYCHGASKLIRATEIAGSCNGGSDCYGIPMGWTNGTREEVCQK